MNILVLRILRSYQSSAMMIGLRLFGALAAILANLILARTLDVEQLSAAWTTVSMAIVATIFLTLGVDAASVRIVAHRLAVGDLAKAKGFVLFTLRLTYISGAIWVAAFWTAALILPGSDDGFLRERLIFIGAIAPVIGHMRVLAMHTLADGRAVPSSVPRLALLPFLQMVGIYLATLVFSEISVVFFLSLYSICILVVTTIQWITFRPLRDRLQDTEPDFSMRRDWLVTSGFLAVPALLTDFSRDIISALSVTAMSALDVAVLAMALKLTAFLRFGIVAINQVFSAPLRAAIARDDTAEIDKLLAVSTLLKIGPVAILALILQVFGTEIMVFFSPELATGGPVLFVLTIETILLVLCGPSAVFMSLGKGHYILPAFGILSVATMCVLTLLFAPAYGALGAAWAFSVAWGLWAILGMIYVQWQQGRDISILSALRWGLAHRAGS